MKSLLFLRYCVSESFIILAPLVLIQLWNNINLVKYNLTRMFQFADCLIPSPWGEASISRNTGPKSGPTKHIVKNMNTANCEKQMSKLEVWLNLWKFSVNSTYFTIWINYSWYSSCRYWFNVRLECRFAKWLMSTLG